MAANSPFRITWPHFCQGQPEGSNSKYYLKLKIYRNVSDARLLWFNAQITSCRYNYIVRIGLLGNVVPGMSTDFPNWSYQHFTWDSRWHFAKFDLWPLSGYILNQHDDLLLARLLSPSPILALSNLSDPPRTFHSFFRDHRCTSVPCAETSGMVWTVLLVLGHAMEQAWGMSELSPIANLNLDFEIKPSSVSGKVLCR